MKLKTFLSMLGILLFFNTVNATTYVYTSIDYPDSSYTYVNDINNNGDIVGQYSNGTSFYGYLFDGTAYSTLLYPGADNTAALGINDDGIIVMRY